MDFQKKMVCFSPVDINQFSSFPEEKEVLFPPFYPIRIINVLQEENYYRIIALAPTCVNIAGKDFLSQVTKQSKEGGKLTTLKIF